MNLKNAPLSDSVIFAISRLIDDSQLKEKREPTHSDLNFIVERVGLTKVDPKYLGQSVGKAKRIRSILSWAIDNNPSAGEKLVKLLIDNVRGNGGFREASRNFVGTESIETLRQTFLTEGYNLSSDGEIMPMILDNLSDKEMTEALRAYVKRARKGVLDAALLTGTGKDLLEAVSKHVLLVKQNISNPKGNFPYLLAQAFMALNMVTSEHKRENNESSLRRYERALYDLGCAINSIRNKEGTGHGRIFLPSISKEEAINAVQSIGIIADYMLRKLEKE